MSLTFANLAWGQILGHVHAFDRLGAPLRLALIQHSLETRDFTKHQDKVLRSQGWITGPRHEARPNAQGVALIVLATIANNGMADLQDDPSGAAYRRLLEPSGDTDLIRRLGTLHGAVAQTVSLTPNLPLRVELARTSPSWDWTGLAMPELSVQDLRLIRERGQHLLTWLTTLPTAPTLAVASDHLALPTPLATRAFQWLLRNLIVFLHFDPHQGQVLLGLHPERQKLPGRPLPPPPADLVLPPGNQELFTDCAAVLICAGETPVSILKTGDISAKSLKILVSRLGPAEPHPALVPQDPEERALRAVAILRMVGLLNLIGNEMLPSTAAGTWLTLPPEDRARPLAQAIRTCLISKTDLSTGPEPWMFWVEGYFHIHVFCKESLRLIAAFGPHPRSRDEWARFVERWEMPPRYAHMEKFFRDDLGRLLSNVLVGTDLIRLDKSVIGLSPEGAWAFGLTDTWPAPSTVVPVVTQPLIVQADFTLIFLAPSAATEIQVAGFCERLPGATGTGVLYRVTKASVQRGAGQRLTGEEMVQRLRQASSKALPGNVEREIIGWVGSIRLGEVRMWQVVTVPDEASAQVLLNLAKPKHGAMRLGPLLVGFLPAASLAPLFTQARAKGLIIEAPDQTSDGQDFDDDRW